MTERSTGKAEGKTTKGNVRGGGHDAEEGPASDTSERQSNRAEKKGQEERGEMMTRSDQIAYPGDALPSSLRRLSSSVSAHTPSLSSLAVAHDWFDASDASCPACCPTTGRSGLCGQCVVDEGIIDGDAYWEYCDRCGEWDCVGG